MSTEWGTLKTRMQLAHMSREHRDGALLTDGTTLRYDNVELVEGEQGLMLVVPEESEGGWCAIGRTAIPGMLPAFVRLASQQPIDVLRFARRWGMLGLCKHMLPESHRSNRIELVREAHWEATPGSPRWCLGPDLRDYLGGELGNDLGQAAVEAAVAEWALKSFEQCKPTLAEPVAVWQQLAHEARALLSIAARVHRGEPAAPADWRTIYGYDPSWYPDVALDAFTLESVITMWLDVGDVIPRLKWETKVDWAAAARRPAEVLWRQRGYVTIQGPPEVVLRARGLFAIIARELAFTIARVSSMAICAGCGAAFTPRRRPVHGRRSWCDDCRERGVSKTQAVRDHRARKRGDSGKKRR
jgi:hypothetical protein